MFLARAEFISKRLCLSGMRPTWFKTDRPLNRSPSSFHSSLLVFTIVPTVLSPPCLLFFFSSSSILWPTQLLTQSGGSGRPGFLWLYLAMNRCSALERNTPPLLASVCVCVCVWPCASLSVTLPSYQFSHHALLTLTQQHSTGELGQNWPVCPLT